MDKPLKEVKNNGKFEEGRFNTAKELLGRIRSGEISASMTDIIYYDIEVDYMLSEIKNGRPTSKRNPKWINPDEIKNDY